MSCLRVIVVLGVLSSTGFSTERFSFAEEPERLCLKVGGDTFTCFHYESTWPKPFLYPIRSAWGQVVSRGWPVEPRPGESEDHVWHRGIWFTHGDINGVDFWRELGEGKTGRITVEGKPEGRIRNGVPEIRARLALLAPNGEKLGTVSQTFVFRFLNGDRLAIDAAVTIHADRGKALKLGDTKEGTFALRLRDEFTPEHGGVLLNSEGVTGNLWGKRARWVDYSSTIGGEKIGVSMFDHPTNPKSPTWWMAREYGLCAANAFGEHDFLADPKRDGSRTISAGASLTLQYRILVHRGNAQDADVAARYAEYVNSAGR